MFKKLFYKTNPEIWEQQKQKFKEAGLFDIRPKDIPVFFIRKTKEFKAWCIESYQKLHDLATTNYDLAYWHLGQGNIADAKLRFRFVNKLKPNFYPDAYYYLGRFQLMEEQTEENKQQAIEYFKKAVELKPKYTEAIYMLGRLTDADKVKAIPHVITQGNFDNIAQLYEEEFVEGLNYEAHKQLVRALDDVLGDDIKPMRILDLGCGTGRCGLELKRKNMVRQMDGVDISQKMIEQAELRRHNNEPVYDFLTRQDLVDFLKDKKKEYELITAAAVFYYLGDLEPVLKACKAALKPKGLLAFSVEGKMKADKDMILNPDLDCFSYSYSYISKVAKEAGLVEKKCKEITLYDGCDGLQFVYSAK